MIHKPKVSIVIPLYNGSNYVEEAIKCAIAQTYENIEIVVVNDGSTDEGKGRAVCEKYADKIVYFEKENGGCASALNYGIRKATGDFISWLSHDDLYMPEKIEKQVEAYDKHGLNSHNTVISNVGILIDSEGREISHPKRKTAGFFGALSAFEYILMRACPNGCGLLIPRELFERCGYFSESLRFVLDWNLWLKFALRGVDFYFDSEPLVANRVHSMQVTVKQKELHSKEADMTVDELSSLMTEEGASDEYWKLLYTFSYSCGRGDSSVIAALITKKGIKVNRLKLLLLRARSKAKRLLKTVYHKIR